MWKKEKQKISLKEELKGKSLGEKPFHVALVLVKESDLDCVWWIDCEPKFTPILIFACNLSKVANEVRNFLIYFAALNFIFRISMTFNNLDTLPLMHLAPFCRFAKHLLPTSRLQMKSPDWF